MNNPHNEAPRGEELSKEERQKLDMEEAVLKVMERGNWFPWENLKISVLEDRKVLDQDCDQIKSALQKLQEEGKVERDGRINAFRLLKKEE